MVKESIKNGRKIYQCEECGLMYAEAALARACEKYCKSHHACSIDITSKAVRRGNVRHS